MQHLPPPPIPPPPAPFRRRGSFWLHLLILLLGATGALFLWMRLGEPNRLVLREEFITLEHLTRPIRVLHLSDLHVSDAASYERARKACLLGLEQKPDVAFITGDFISDKLPPEPVCGDLMRFLSGLAQNVPVYACLGNHDTPVRESLRQKLTAAGITVLDNERVTPTVLPFTIVGIGDLWSENAKPEQVLAAQRELPQPLLVLVHNPDTLAQLKPYDWDVACAGHSHGGQFCFPFTNWRPFMPLQDNSLASGLISIADNRWLNVSDGIGNLHELRLNCPPEVVILNLQPAVSLAIPSTDSPPPSP